MADVRSDGSRSFEAYSTSVTDVIRRIDEISTEIEMSSEKAVDDLKGSVASIVDCLMTRERHLSLQIDRHRMEMGLCLRDMKEKLQKAVDLVEKPEVSGQRKFVRSSHGCAMTKLKSMTQSMASDVERVGEISRMRLDATLEEEDLKKAIELFGHRSDVYAGPFNLEMPSLTAFQECLDWIARNGRASDSSKLAVGAETGWTSGIEQDGSTPCQKDLKTRQKEQDCPITLESSTIEFGSSTRRQSEAENISQLLYRPELPCPSETEICSKQLKKSCKWAAGSGWTSSCKQEILNETCTSNGMTVRKLEEFTPQCTSSNAEGNKRCTRNHQAIGDIMKWIHRPRTLFQDSNDMKKWLKQEIVTSSETTLCSNSRGGHSDSPMGTTHRNGTLDSDETSWSRQSMTSSSSISPAAALCLALERHKATPNEMWLIQERSFSNTEPEDHTNQRVRSTSDKPAVQWSTLKRNDYKKEDYREWLLPYQKWYCNSLDEDYSVWLAPDSDRRQTLFFPFLDSNRHQPKSLQKLIKHSSHYMLPPSPVPAVTGFNNSTAKALLSSGSGMDDIHMWLSPRCQSADSGQGDSTINSSVNSQVDSINNGCHGEMECEEFEVIETGDNISILDDEWEYEPELLLQGDSH